MKRYLLALLASVIFASPAFALVGGPWDNNIPGNTSSINPTSFNGTYQGTIKGKNLAGVMMFGTSTIGTSVTLTSATSGTTSSSVNVQGFSVAFFEGTTAVSQISVILDLSARKLAGVIEGAGSRPVTQTLVRPATSTTPEADFEVYNNIYFNGAFNAKFPYGWANTRFTGSGYVLVKKVDFDGFYLQLITNPTTATPQIVTVPTLIKVAGTKTSNTSTSYYVTFPDVTEPQWIEL